MTGLLPASILPGLMETALKGRVNVQALFEQAGIDADAVGRPDRFITLDQLDTLLSTAFAQADDPWFGLTVGRENHYGNLDLLGNLMATADDLIQALQLLFDYKDLLAPYLQFELKSAANYVVLSVASDESLRFTRTRTHNEIVVATMVSIGRSLVGGDLGLKEIRFRHSRPADLQPYEAFFQVPMAFNQSRNALLISTDRLSVTLPTAFPKYNQRLRKLADEQLAGLKRAYGISEQVLDLLRTRLGEAATGIDDIAASLNMTARTLQRRLRKEDMTFGQLRDQVRLEAAREALLQKHCDMEQLAVRLGFSDTANFYHAFRRWAGCSPGQFQRQQLQGNKQ